MVLKTLFPMLITLAVCVMTGFATTCITRMDCIDTDEEGHAICYDSHFNIDLDTNGGIGIGGHGECSQCAHLSVDECYAPCYVSDANCAPDPLIFALNLDHQIPLLLSAIFSISKLVFNQVFLTPSKPGQTTSLTTTLFRSLAIFLMFVGMKNDVEKAWAALTDSSMSWWFAFESVGVIWQTSSNMPSATAVFAQVVFVKSVKIGLEFEVVQKAEQKVPLLQSIGRSMRLEPHETKQSPVESHADDDFGKTLLVFYARSITLLYTLPGMLRVTLTLPSLICYFWFFLPIVLFCRILAVPLAPIVAKLTLGMVSGGELKFMPEFITALRNIISEHKDSGLQMVYRARWLKLQEDALNMKPVAVLTGHDHWHEDGNLETAVVAVLLPTVFSIAVTAQARWMDNYGYLQALYLTLKERNMATFLNLSRSSATQSLNLLWRFV